MNETDLSRGVSDAEFSVVELWAAALNDMTPAEFIELAEKRRAVLFRSARRDLIREGLLDLMPREREAEIFRRLDERGKGVEDDHPSPAGPSRSAELDNFELGNFVASFLSLDEGIGMALVDDHPSPAGPSRSAEMFSELIERLSEASKDPLGRWHRPPPRRRHRPLGDCRLPDARRPGSRSDMTGTAMPDIDERLAEDVGEDVHTDRPWIVLVWNDPINLMSYVAFVFRKLFGYSRQKADKLMLDVHHKGRAVVSSGTREKAEMDVFRLHEHGLWATMQQDD